MSPLSIILIGLFVAFNVFGIGPTRSNKPFDEVKKLAEQGVFDFVYELGCRYERGEKGATQDFKEAVRWHCKNKNGSPNRSMHRLEKIADADPEIKDPTDAPEIYCSQKKEPKPSLEDYSPALTSWCSPQDADTDKNCFWRKVKLDKYGNRLSAKEISDIAIAQWPPLSKSRDWYLNEVWLYGLYGGALSPYTWPQYQNGLIIEDENQRPSYTLEIRTKYLKKIKTGFTYSEPTSDGRLKLLLELRHKGLGECFERATKGYFKRTVLVFNESPHIDRKNGRIVSVSLIKDCYGR